MRNFFKLLLPLIIVAAAIAVTIFLFKSKSQPEKKDFSQRDGVTIVETQEILPDAYPITIQAYGSIEASNRSNVMPQVSGSIVEMYPGLQQGLQLNKGDLIVAIDDVDYRLRVEVEKSNVAKAEFALTEERGRQVLAKREWELLDESVKKEDISEDLVLRKAHLRERQAALKSAKSGMELALLNLSRTQVLAPCDGVVMSKSVAMGQVVSQNSSIIDFVCVDRYQTVLSVAQSDLGQLNADAATVTIKGMNFSIKRVLPALDAQTKTAQVLVEIDNPLGLEKAIFIGEYVDALIQGDVIEDVYKIPLSALREGDRLWVKKQDELAIIDVDPVFTRGQDVYVTSTELDAIEVVTSYIATPFNKMKVKTR